MRWSAIISVGVFILAGGWTSSARAADITPHLCLNVGGHTAPVRALTFSADSKRLFSAGQDKVVISWDLAEVEDLAATEFRAKGLFVQALARGNRTLRWEVGRGRRGAIYAMALSPADGRVAIGGFGSRGLSGEVAILDPISGAFDRYLKVHKQTIYGLAYSPDGRWLATLDMSGKAMLWASGGEASRTLAESDAEAYGPEVQAASLAYLSRRPVVFLGNHAVVAPAYAGPAADGRMLWKLQLYSLPSGSPQRLLETEHYGQVFALASTADGRFLASSDQRGGLFLTDLKGDGQSVAIQSGGAAFLSLAFSPDGSLLAAGTVKPEGDGSQLLIWDVFAAQARHRFPLSEPVAACAFSPDGAMLAHTGEDAHDIFLRRTNALAATPYVFRGGAQVTKVSFAPGTAHTLVFQSQASRGEVARSFDFSVLQMGPSAEFAPPQCFLGRWSYQADAVNNRLWIYADSQPIGHIQLDREKQGLISTATWIPGSGGEPAGVAIGTNYECGIFVYGLSTDGQWPLLRYFRGHHDVVNSLAVSPDRRYLVSGSRDGTVRCWDLRGYERGLTSPRARWGGELAVRGGELLVTAVDDLGPLFTKGVRAGDAITEIMWAEPAGNRSERDPAAIAGRLRSLDWRTQVAFFTTRQGAPREPFQLLGAWQQMLALYATAFDWVAWTPAGYYACSAGGQRLIGWQVNNEAGEAPTFHSAEKYSALFDRPDVIRQLLDVGDLRMTLAAMQQQPVEIAETRPPRVRILTPQASQTQVTAARTSFQVLVEPLDGHPVREIGLLVDGNRLGAPRACPTTGVRSLLEEFVVDVPAGRHRYSAWARTDALHATSAEIEISFLSDEPVRRTLYVMALGVSKYQDRDSILEFAHTDAQKVAARLESGSQGLFDDVVVKTVLDGDATKAGIEAAFAWLGQRVKTDDIVVLYYSGHGVVEQGRFYVLPADFRRDRIAESCVSEDTIAQFCKTTSGTLVFFLDACHSGAFDDLAKRLGQDMHGMLVLASSTAQQKSYEFKKFGGGVFTHVLIEGLNGEADRGRRNGKVECPHEIYPFVYEQLEIHTEGKQRAICNMRNMESFALTRILQ